MTISSTTRKAGPFIGNGTTTAFPFAYKVFQASDLLVVRLDTTLNIEHELTLNTDYTVTLNLDQDSNPGGTVNLLAALATGYTLTLTSDLANLQPTDLTNQGGFYPDVINDALDRATIQIQQLQEQTDRSLKVALSSTADATLPPPAPNDLIGWDATGEALVNVDPGSIATVVTYATAYCDVFVGNGITTSWTLTRDPAVLYNLDVSINGSTQEPTRDYTLSGTTFTMTTPPPIGARVVVKYKEGLPNVTADAQDVRFIQAGTGAVSRTALAKMREWVTPEDFGAPVDGVSDDAPAIQRAINTGKNVLFVASQYRIKTKLLFNQTGCTYMAQNSALVYAADTPTSTRLADITGNRNTFINVHFNGGGIQPRSALLYVDSNVDRPKFINCRFEAMTGRSWGSNVTNAMYAVLISPYGVTNFLFENCAFKDLIKYNDGVNTVPVTPAFVGGGFVGGICFLPETLLPPTNAQPVVTSGIVHGCLFENIQTIRAAGLSDNDAIEFNDADAIRTYGEVGGATDLWVHVSDCIFRNVSKRCFKFRASGSIAYDNECYAADLPYPMTSPIDLTSNTKVINLKIYASSAMPVYNAVTWSVGPVFNREALIQGLFVSHCINGINFFSSPANEALNNFFVRDCQFNQCSFSGIYQSAPLPQSMSNIIIENTQIWGSANNTSGLSIIGTSGPPNAVSTGLKISNVYISNAAVYLGGTDNSVTNMTVEISSSSFAGPSASAGLVRIGDTGYGGFQNIDGLFINAWNLNTGFLSASRTVLNQFSADNGTFKNVRIKVPQGLGVTYPHASIWGREMNFDGLQYDGPGRINVGTEQRLNRCSITNAVRLSNNGSASTEAFFYISNVLTDEIVFNGIVDFRPTTEKTIVVNLNGGKIAAFNVVSNSSAAEVVTTGGVVLTGNVGKFGSFSQSYTTSNVATNRTLDANTITAADLADVVGTLITDLRAVGIIRN